MMIKPIHWMIVMMLVAGVVIAFSVTAEEGKGADTMTLNGGSRGMVPFPHAKHQEVVASCNRCHDLFPKTAGSLDQYKADGKLKKKQVMNTLCISCHKEKQKEGVANAPVSCSQCHQK